jgi:hypothetical protein
MASTISSVEGTVTAWRLQGANATPGYEIEVLHPEGGGAYRITAASAQVTPTGPALQTFTTNLPIKAGDYLGVVTPEGGEFPLVEGSSTIALAFLGGAPGSTTGPVGELGGPEPFAMGFNADITPAGSEEEGEEEKEKEVVIQKEVVTNTVQAPPQTVTKVVEVPAQTGPQCKVPKLVGKTLAAAKQALKKAGCKVGFVIRPRGAKAATAKVRRTVPKPGTELPLGTPVSLKLG